MVPASFLLVNDCSKTHLKGGFEMGLVMDNQCILAEKARMVRFLRTSASRWSETVPSRGLSSR